MKPVRGWAYETVFRMIQSPSTLWADVPIMHSKPDSLAPSVPVLVIPLDSEYESGPVSDEQMTAWCKAGAKAFMCQTAHDGQWLDNTVFEVGDLLDLIEKKWDVDMGAAYRFVPLFGAAIGIEVPGDE